MWGELQIAVPRGPGDRRQPGIVKILNSDRHSLHFNIVSFTFALNLTGALGGKPRSRNEYLLDPLLVNDFFQQAVAAENPEAVNHFALLQRIVVHKTNRRATQLAVVQQLAQQEFAGVAGSVDQ